MSWKDIRLSKKFAIGFGLILALLLIIGIWSINSINTIMESADEVTNHNNFANELLQREIDHLNWAESLSLFLNDKNVRELKIERDHRKCAFGKWFYGQGRETAEELYPELKSYLKSIEEPHYLLHASAISISKVFKEADSELPTFLAQKEVEHLAWTEKIQDAILVGNPEIDIQFDYTKCSFGRFIYGDEGENISTSDSELKSLLTGVATPHRQLHEAGLKIQETLLTRNKSKAIQIYSDELLPVLMNVRNYLNNMQKRAQENLQGKKEADQIYATETQPKLVKVQQLLADMNNIVKEKIIQKEKSIKARGISTRTVVIVVSIVSIVIGILIATFITRTITGPITKGVEFAKKVADGDLTTNLELYQKDELGILAEAFRTMLDKLRIIVSDVMTAATNVSSGSQQMSSSSEELSQGASEQASSAEEASSSMEEMAANIQQNADNAQQTEKIAVKASNDANDGGQAVAQTVTAMKEIASKISIIEEIARQTNLLALNAAIEAARAGEHGKGFAVVASEVRKLAERSQTAAGEINQLAGSSVHVAEKAGDMLKQLVPDIKRTAELVQEISAASKEQSGGVEQINKAIQQLDTVTQQNAGASEEMASTAEELASQAEQLQNTIQYFKIDESSGTKITQNVFTKPKKAKPSPVVHVVHEDDHAKAAPGKNKATQTEKPKGVALDLKTDSHKDNMDAEFERF